MVSHSGMYVPVPSSINVINGSYVLDFFERAQLFRACSLFSSMFTFSKRVNFLKLILPISVFAIWFLGASYLSCMIIKMTKVTTVFGKTKLIAAKAGRIFNVFKVSNMFEKIFT